MRRAIAQEMTKSIMVAPHVTSVFECDFEAVIADRAARKDEFAKRGVRLTMTAYLVRAAALALRQVPEVNASWHPDHTVQHGAINIGVASAMENAQGGGAGLAVPVVRDAASLDLFGIAQTLQRYADAVKGSKLASADLSGGTFTISNHGVSGSLFAAPIVILQPQVAILGVGKVEKRLVVSEIAGREVIETRSKAYVTLTIDHRALDGFTANRFLTILTTSLQTPASLG
jgi:2-oxoglutarate dehydrogenase E2 component (dihydrolipoamide succinyltransferase)